MTLTNRTSDIVSPMAWGNGAYVVHRILEHHIDGYKVVGYHPNWTLFPFSLIKIAPTRNSHLVHTTPDYAVFFQRKNIPLVISFQNYVMDRSMGQYSAWWQRLHYRTDLLIEHGLQILFWQQHVASPNQQTDLTPEIMATCFQNHPHISLADLITSTVTFAAQKN